MKKNRNFMLLSIIAVLQGLVFYAPIATLYRQNRGIGLYDIFVIETINLVLTIFFEVPWGFFADKFGYKNTLVIAFLVNFISKIVFFKANNFSLFLLERILLAISISGVSGCDIALIYNSVGEKNSERAFSLYNTFSIIGFFIGTVLSTFIISKSMNLAVLATIFPYGAAFVVSLFLKDTVCDMDKKESIKDVLKATIKSKDILIFLVAIGLTSEVCHSITVFLNQLQYKRAGIEVKYYGLILALVQIISIVSVKTYKLTGKFGKGKVITFIFCAILLSSISLIWVNNPIVSVILIVIIGLGQAVIIPIASEIESKSVKVSSRATVLSVYAIIIDIIAALINLIIGKAANYSIEAAFLTCGVLVLFAVVLNIIYFKRRIFKNE
ncbi:MFS transporter [Clostridium felsineum]|uniref:MFS transporter n=1 Tax=Clostridium felsineum TaxID=36839 RepID=UPI0009CF9F95|nr:MFS transporter [Clostridium felsineum]URZ14064.1 hypothetical protein CLFE_000390 [Clostridium felsineum DSM 794]